ncbi:hypothetical protein TWF718_005678 [Orbilia javanica]|uniref:Uncharacterized protein n=1 Tax=Orbilia javanica TaxID=47235 RepID=A0AAN8MZB7_9PEZI
MASVSPHTKLSLNPSAPVFNPRDFFEPKAEPEPSISPRLITKSQKTSDSTSLSSRGSPPNSIDIAKPTNPEFLKHQDSTQPSGPQRKLERLVYIATRNSLTQSPLNSITCLSTSAAQNLIKSHVNSSHLEFLLRQYEMEELAGAVTKMHFDKVYASTPDTIKEKWQWLLDGDISEIRAIEAGAPLFQASDPGETQPTSILKEPPSKTNSDKSLSNTLFATKRSRFSSTYTSSVLDDNTYSVMSFGPSSGVPRAIDPDNVYFPYPTLRTILKEARRILKAAFYEFIKRYFPEKLNHRALEFPENSSLSQIISMVQDIINYMGDYQFPTEATEILTRIRDLDSNTNCLNSASELYDLISRRREVSISELNPLLANILGLIKALGAPEWSKKQRALNKYASVLAADLENKFKEIQSPIRCTLQRINEQREALAAEEEVVSRKYRQDEKEIQRHFMVDADTLRRIILVQENSATEPPTTAKPTDSTPGRPTSKEHVIEKEARILDIKRSALLAPPDICVWDPQKQLIDYQPSAAPVRFSSHYKKSDTTRRPWDPVSIDLALDELDSKENIRCGANPVAHITKDETSLVQEAGPQVSKHALEVGMPSKHSKISLTMDIEGLSQQPTLAKKAEPMPKYSPCYLSNDSNAQESNLLIDL